MTCNTCSRPRLPFSTTKTMTMTTSTARLWLRHCHCRRNVTGTATTIAIAIAAGATTTAATAAGATVAASAKCVFMSLVYDALVAIASENYRAYAPDSLPIRTLRQFAEFDEFDVCKFLLLSKANSVNLFNLSTGDIMCPIMKTSSRSTNREGATPNGAGIEGTLTIYRYWRYFTSLARARAARLRDQRRYSDASRSPQQCEMAQNGKLHLGHNICLITRNNNTRSLAIG